VREEGRRKVEVKVEVKVEGEGRMKN